MQPHDHRNNYSDTIIDDMPVTVPPFEYNEKDWHHNPIRLFDNYIKTHKLPRYNVNFCEDGSDRGYFATLTIGNHTFSSPAYNSTTRIAKINVIILALLNLVGYCDTAKELQEKIHADLRKYNRSYARQHKSTHPERGSSQNDRNKLSRSVDTYFSNERDAQKCSTAYPTSLSHISASDDCQIKIDAISQNTNNIQSVDSARGISRFSRAEKGETEYGENNLLLKEFQIDGIVFSASTTRVVVLIPRTIEVPSGATHLRCRCYEMDISLYKKSLGRASWVYHIGKHPEKIYVHPSKVIIKWQNELYYEPYFIPNNKNLQDYCNAKNYEYNCHLVLLFPLKSGCDGIYLKGY